ncbi:MAG: hypothetical protein ACYDG2_11580 [Ruminiclostridium sp.]
MSLRPRYMPADIKEDIKIGGILPLDALPWIIGSFLLGIVYAFISTTGFITKIILTFIPPIILFTVFAFDLYNRFIKWVDFIYSKKKVKNLSDICNISEYTTICKTKNKYNKMFLECSVNPWEVCPDSIKEQRANIFAEEVFSALKDKTQINIFATSAPESTVQLDERFSQLDSYPEGLREIEDARIAVHFKYLEKLVQLNILLV